MSFSNIIILLGAAQGVFLALVLFVLKKGGRLSNRLLSGFLFVFSLQMLAFVVWDSRWILKFPHLSMIASPLDFLLGPLFYLYSLSLTKKDFSLKKTDWLHFLLYITGTLYFIPFYLKSAEEKAAFNLASYEKFPEMWTSFSIVASLQSVVYIVLTVLVLLQHARNMKRYYSSMKEVDLGWIKNIIAFIILTYISCVFISVIGWKWANQFSNIVFSILIYAIGYLAIRQKNVFAGIKEEIDADEVVPLIATAEGTTKKYEKSGLNYETANNLAAKLDELMINEKPFLNAELSLQQLADKMQISLHHLSQVLNQVKQQSFFDYISELRIEEFKRQLKNPSLQHLSLLGLALECGFNSKAAFNSSFKKYTGTTPSAYKQSLN